ncbi:uncharacterized protein LOC5513363 isoform X2 [Nematostella vectensis]|uniref:uncharacterized protein LOC5513363 isoform X2 n=1 Tax=Nematostella vectensis TaxID=45351 RepID=UPI002076D585|nr:uncharacterized protein LOC5513363 isoform X2 [Nematostella vectensis]
MDSSHIGETLALRTVKVTDFPEGLSKNDLWIHFQKRRNGGGDVEDVILEQDGSVALVIFENEEVASSVLSTPQVSKGATFNVEKYQLTSYEPEVFSSVSAVINQDVFQQYVDRMMGFLNKLKADTNITWEKCSKGYLLTGSFNQISVCHQMLEEISEKPIHENGGVTSLYIKGETAGHQQTCIAGSSQEGIPALNGTAGSNAVSKSLSALHQVDAADLNMSVPPKTGTTDKKLQESQRKDATDRNVPEPQGNDTAETVVQAPQKKDADDRNVPVPQGKDTAETVVQAPQKKDADDRNVPVHQGNDTAETVVQAPQKKDADDRNVPVHQGNDTAETVVQAPQKKDADDRNVPVHQGNDTAETVVQAPQKKDADDRNVPVPQGKDTAETVVQAPQKKDADDRNVPVPQGKDTAETVVQAPQKKDADDRNVPVPQGKDTAETVVQAPQKKDADDRNVPVPQGKDTAETVVQAPQKKDAVDRNVPVLQGKDTAETVVQAPQKKDAADRNVPVLQGKDTAETVVQAPQKKDAADRNVPVLQGNNTAETVVQAPQKKDADDRNVPVPQGKDTAETVVQAPQKKDADDRNVPVPQGKDTAETVVQAPQKKDAADRNVPVLQGKDTAETVVQAPQKKDAADRNVPVPQGNDTAEKVVQAPKQKYTAETNTQEPQLNDFVGAKLGASQQKETAKNSSLVLAQDNTADGFPALQNNTTINSTRGVKKSSENVGQRQGDKNQEAGTKIAAKRHPLSTNAKAQRVTRLAGEIAASNYSGNGKAVEKPREESIPQQTTSKRDESKTPSQHRKQQEKKEQIKEMVAETKCKPRQLEITSVQTWKAFQAAYKKELVTVERLSSVKVSIRDDKVLLDAIAGCDPDMLDKAFSEITELYRAKLPDFLTVRFSAKSDIESNSLRNILMKKRRDFHVALEISKDRKTWELIGEKETVQKMLTEVESKVKIRYASEKNEDENHEDKGVVAAVTDSGEGNVRGGKNGKGRAGEGLTNDDDSIPPQVLKQVLAVIHAVGPTWGGATPEQVKNQLFRACLESLYTADNINLCSIAFPAISSGIYGVPKEICAQVMLDAVEHYAEKRNESGMPGVSDIRLVNIDEPTVRAFMAEFRRRYGEGTGEKSGSPVPTSLPSGGKSGSPVTGSLPSGGKSGSTVPTSLPSGEKSGSPVPSSVSNGGNSGSPVPGSVPSGGKSGRPVSGSSPNERSLSKKDKGPSSSDKKTEKKNSDEMVTGIGYSETSRIKKIISSWNKPDSNGQDKGKAIDQNKFTASKSDIKHPPVNQRPETGYGRWRGQKREWNETARRPGQGQQAKPAAESNAQTDRNARPPTKPTADLSQRTQSTQAADTRSRAQAKPATGPSPTADKKVADPPSRLLGGARPKEFRGHRKDEGLLSIPSKSSDDLEGKCPICYKRLRQPETLPCQHKFCASCLTQATKQFPHCPVCRAPQETQQVIVQGNQPDGSMLHRTQPHILPGYETAGSIVIQYAFPSGIQYPHHPNPGQPYDGTVRKAYLPDTPEGREVLRLLRKAFDARLVFKVGRSLSSGLDNQIVWNVLHKTSVHGGPENYGYPDPFYLSDVKEELADLGIK